MIPSWLRGAFAPHLHACPHVPPFPPSVSLSTPECQVRTTKGTPGKPGCGPPFVTPPCSESSPPSTLTPLSERHSQERQTRLSGTGERRKKKRKKRRTSTSHSLHPSPSSPFTRQEVLFRPGAACARPSQPVVPLSSSPRGSA